MKRRVFPLTFRINMKVLSVMAERTYVRYLNLNYHLERVSFYNVARRKESVTRKTYMTDIHTTCENYRA